MVCSCVSGTPQRPTPLIHGIGAIHIQMRLTGAQTLSSCNTLAKGMDDTNTVSVYPTSESIWQDGREHQLIHGTDISLNQELLSSCPNLLHELGRLFLPCCSGSISVLLEKVQQRLINLVRFCSQTTDANDCVTFWLSSQMAACMSRTPPSLNM